VARVLFAWEFGANFGHLARDIPVASSLRNAGHLPILVVSDLRLAAELATPHNLAYAQAPRIAASYRPRYRPPASYSERLLMCGYSDVRALVGALQGWLSLYQLIRPNVVVADSAPTAMLAAVMADVPLLLLGSGFEIPVCTHPMPWTSMFELPDPSRLLRADAAVLGSINLALSAFQRPGLDAVAGLFRERPTLLTTFPELDHYSGRSSARYVGPIGLDVGRSAPPWPKTGRLKVLAYLRPFMARVIAIINSLERPDLDVICVIPDADRNLLTRTPSRLVVHPHAIHLSQLLSEADAVVTYGGSGLVAQALLAGVPLLLFPEFSEQATTAARVEKLGAGLWFRDAQENAHVDATLDTFLNALSTYRDAARCFRSNYRDYSASTAVETVCSAIWQAAEAPLLN
jgi:UDP:flavonoid glycosyltransferase YjiC (YdhE family)